MQVLVVFSDFEKMQQARSVLIEKLDKIVCVGDPYYSHSAESLFVKVNNEPSASPHINLHC